MTKHEMLEQHKTQAMKNQDKVRKDVLSGMIDACRKASIPKSAKETRQELTDVLVNETLIKYQSMVQEQIDQLQEQLNKGADAQKYAGAMERYKVELEIVKEYAPQLISDYSTIENMLVTILKENQIIPNHKNKGFVMKTIMPAIKGQVNMGVANQVITDLISKGE